MAMQLRFPPAAILLTSAALACAASASGVLGNWKTPSGSVVRIDRCGSNVCLWITAPPPQAARTDLHNPDPALRSRPICNLKIGSGFTLNNENRASGGTLYDPKTGKTYHGAMTADGSTLHLRGYVGIPLFGASQDWTRITEPVEQCH